MSASLVSSDESRLPDFFPGTVKACQAPSEVFFSCFTLNTVKKDENDTLAGSVGLAACAKELKAYKACMEKHLPRIEAKKFRVSYPLDDIEWCILLACQKHPIDYPHFFLMLFFNRFKTNTEIRVKLLLLP